jgi:PhzF family phenazine biosynthesis protein
MQQYILSSFVAKGKGGNKAAVVFDDIGLSENEMLRIAKKNNFSETAFIDFNSSSDTRYNIRYFTTVEEVDICGHAALASFQLLKQLGYANEETVYHRTRAGELKVITQDDIILIEMKRPEVVMQLTVEEVIRTINIDKTRIVLNRNGMIDVIYSGLRDIILEVDGLDTLRNLCVNKEEMIKLCREYNLIGMHVVSRETIEEDSDFTCRNFAPIVGIDEESATGTSNASMLHYFINNYKEFNINKTYKVEQGYYMNSPSNIFVKADKDTGSIFVGGIARIENMEEIII